MFKQYRKKGITEMRPYVVGESMEGVTISDLATKAGSPRDGDMIARDPDNHDDKWLVTTEFFKNYEPV